MGGLTVSGGGEVAVSTDDLLARAAGLRSASRTVEEWSHALITEAGAPIRTLDLGGHPDDGGGELMLAGAELRHAGTEFARLASDLTTGAENYGRAERSAALALESAGARIGYGLGAAMPFTLFALAGPLTALAIGVVATVPATGSVRASVRRMARALGSRAGLLCDPRFTTLLRVVVSSADDAMLGAARVPLPVALALDDRGLGWFGLQGAAREVVGAASIAGALTETPVTVHRSGTARARAPDGYAAIAARIPDNEKGDSQIRIEKYEVADGRPGWIVYVGGTIDPGFVAEGEPWDDTSNLQGVAGLDPGSVRATEKAMEAAGVQAGDRVVAVGYSQGGIVATDLVTSGRYSNAALITFGSPTGQVDVPSTVPDVAVEMREDVIPALGGLPRPASDGGADRILVQRSAFDGDPPAGGDILAAHHIGNYRTTAAMMDASHDPRLTRVRLTLDEVTGGTPAEVSLWRADRLPAR